MTAPDPDDGQGPKTSSVTGPVAEGVTGLLHATVSHVPHSSKARPGDEAMSRSRIASRREGGNNHLSLDVLVEACDALLRHGLVRAQRMTTIRRFVLRLMSFFRPGAAEAELSREVHS